MVRRWAAYPEMLVIAYLLAVSLVFTLFPAIDLAFSGLFHDADGFTASQNATLIHIRALSDQLVILVMVVLAAAALAKIAWPSRPIAIRPRVSLFLILSLVVGPGLVVNMLFKSHWGRPRPVQVFDGGAPFVPAWQISDACHSNCSFMAGEASSAMWLAAIVILLPRELRRLAIVPFSLILVVISLNRIAFGGHFLSDVLISWGVTLLIVLVCHRLIVRGPAGPVIDRAVDRSLTRAGLALRSRSARS